MVAKKLTLYLLRGKAFTVIWLEALERFVLLADTREYFEEEDGNTMCSLNFISEGWAG